MIVKTSRSLVAVEIQRITEFGRTRWEAVISVPGREGTFVKTWGPNIGEPDEADLTDLCAWVEKTVYNAVILSWGAQGVFPPG